MNIFDIFFFYNYSIVPAVSLFALEASIFDWSTLLCGCYLYTKKYFSEIG